MALVLLFFVGSLFSPLSMTYAAGLTCDLSQSECKDAGDPTVKACCPAKSACALDQAGKVIGCTGSGDQSLCSGSAKQCGLNVNGAKVCCVAESNCGYVKIINAQNPAPGKVFPNGCVANNVFCPRANLQCGSKCCNQTQHCENNECVGGACPAGKTFCASLPATCCNENQICLSKIDAQTLKTYTGCVNKPTVNGRCALPQTCCSASGNCQAAPTETVCCNPTTTCLVNPDPKNATCCPPGSFGVVPKGGKIPGCLAGDYCGTTTCSGGSWCCDAEAGKCCSFTSTSTTSKTSTTNSGGATSSTGNSTNTSGGTTSTTAN